MKIANMKRLKPEQFPGLPESFLPVLDAINENMETLTTALQGNIDRENNLGAERRVVKLKHNTDTDLELKIIKGRARCTGVSPVLHDTFVYAATQVRPGVMRLRVFFDSAPTADQEVEFIFEPV